MAGFGRSNSLSINTGGSLLYVSKHPLLDTITLQLAVLLPCLVRASQLSWQR
jgi:hypothetical protein